MTSDPAIDEIRRLRHEISEECQHDPKRLIEHYFELEKILRSSGEFRFADDLPVSGGPSAKTEKG